MGIFLSSLSSLFWGSTGVLASKGMEKLGALIATFYSNASGAVVLILITIVTGEIEYLFKVTLYQFVFLALAGIASFVMGRSFYFHAITQVGASRAVPITSATVLTGPLIAFILFREAITINIALGIVLIFAGIFLITKRES